MMAIYTCSEYSDGETTKVAACPTAPRTIKQAVFSQPQGYEHRMREPTEHRDSGWSEKHVADVSRLILNFKSFSLIVKQQTTDGIEVRAIFCQSNYKVRKNVQLKNVQPNLQHVAVLRTKQPRGLWGPTKKKGYHRFSTEPKW